MTRIVDDRRAVALAHPLRCRGTRLAVPASSVADPVIAGPSRIDDPRRTIVGPWRCDLLATFHGIAR